MYFVLLWLVHCGVVAVGAAIMVRWCWYFNSVGHLTFLVVGLVFLIVYLFVFGMGCLVLIGLFGYLCGLVAYGACCR